MAVKKEKIEEPEKEVKDVDGKIEKSEPKKEEVKEIKKEAKETESETAKKDLVGIKAASNKKISRRRHVARAKAYILCSYNNTAITISDLDGNVLGWASSGSLGFKGPKKATPFAATLVAQKVIEKTARFGIKEAHVFIRGVGGGREASVRALGNTGLLINSIKDITPTPHNGCRPKKPRRV